MSWYVLICWGFNKVGAAGADQHVMGFAGLVDNDS